jgi:hypothetical protein
MIPYCKKVAPVGVPSAKIDERSGVRMREPNCFERVYLNTSKLRRLIGNAGKQAFNWTSIHFVLHTLFLRLAGFP